MLIGVNQLDSGNIYNFGKSIGVTGEALRPNSTGFFLTDEYLAGYNYISNYIFITSGSINNSGQIVNNTINQTGENLRSGIFETGLRLTIRDNTISGLFNLSGLNIINVITGLSGSFNQTGLNINRTLTGLSGTFNQTGLDLINLARSLGDNAFTRALTGLSGAFNQTGLNIRRLITGLSGAFNQTGQDLTNRLSFYNRVGSNLYISGLTGTLKSEFSLLSGNILYLSGYILDSGLPINNTITGLSGAFNNTGLQFIRTLTGISGTFINNARNIKSGISLIRNNLLKINGGSGSIYFSGKDGILINAENGFLSINISTPETVGKVFDLNNITGTPFITGTGSLTSINIGSGFYISGGAFVPISDSGNFGNVISSGNFLLDTDLLWSGNLVQKINNSITGVSTVNDSFGLVTITGENLLFNNLSGDITISKTGEMPISSEMYYEGQYLTGKFDDDFNEPFLNPKWITYGESALLNSGIDNSYFWANSKKSGLAFLLVQNVITGVDFDVILKANIYRSLETNNFQNIGVCVRDSVNKYAVMFGIDLGDNNSTPQLICSLFTDSTYSASYFTSGFPPTTTHQIDNYFKISCRDKSYSLEHSEDNLLWRPVRTSFSINFNINQVGLLIGTRAANFNRSSTAIDWFRATGLT